MKRGIDGEKQASDLMLSAERQTNKLQQGSLRDNQAATSFDRIRRSARHGVGTSFVWHLAGRWRFGC